ncbi:MAG: flagellar motor protein [Acetobacteraceae bacterium]|nr:flagellar motor protein [Acetobacteraceae bacterium]
MDFATVLGLVISVGAVLVANGMDGGTLGSLVNLSAFILVMGGTIGATATSFPLEDIFTLPRLVLLSVVKREKNPRKTVEMLVEYADKARREGTLSLQNFITGKGDRFLERGLTLVVDGIDPHLVKSILETDLEFVEKRHHVGASILETAGGYAPTMGIIGTVMGLVHVLGKLEDPSKLGPAIAVAFLATFYGISTANLFWLPLAQKLKLRSQRELLVKEMVIEGLLAIQSGENPRMVRDRVEAFLAPRLHAREKPSPAADADSAPSEPEPAP